MCGSTPQGKFSCFTGPGLRYGDGLFHDGAPEFG